MSVVHADCRCSGLRAGLPSLTMWRVHLHGREQQRGAHDLQPDSIHPGVGGCNPLSLQS